eukprot:scaffold37432_cov35-Tisochrysis_lutea.AAC.1
MDALARWVGTPPLGERSQTCGKLQYWTKLRGFFTEYTRDERRRARDTLEYRNMYGGQTESSQHTGSCPPMGKLSIDLVESRVMKQRNHSPEITLLAPGRDR